MSDYPTVDAFVRGDRYTITHVCLEVEAMQKQLEAQKQRIASLTKALADAPYQHQLSQLREQLKKEKEKMSGYPNIDALIQGRVSGEMSEWPMLRQEVMGVMEQLEALRKQLRVHDGTAKFEIRLLDAQLSDKDNQIEAQKKQLTEQGKGLQVTNEEILDKSRRNIALQEQLKEQEQELNTRIELIWQLQTEKAELRKNLSGLCQPIAITDEMVTQANEKIKVLKQFLNNQASTIAKLQRSVRKGCFADDEKIEQLEAQQVELTLVVGCNQIQEGKIKVLKQFLNNQASTIAKLQQDASEAQTDGNKATRCWIYAGEDVATKEMIKDINFLRTANEQLEEKRKTMVATRDEVIANKDEEIEELKRRNANQVFNCRSLREGKIRLREKIKQLRRQRDCLNENFGMGLFVAMPDDLVEVLDEIDGEG